MIEVKDLTKKYGHQLAVDHLNFTIEPGRIYGFLGPNGAGKSTTMNIMTGYLGATSGTVTINGHDILTEPEAAKRQIGYLPEQPPLYTEMTVAEYLGFVAELKKIPKAEREEQLARVTALAQLGEVSHRLIQNLSKGYRQRVGLAQAILGFPEIIILDEPTVGLDPKQIIEIRELIRQLSKQHTVIMSSHILAEVREVCDYIIIISRGRLVACDTPENLEKTMGGGHVIEIQTKAEPTAVAAALAPVDGIKDVAYEAGEDLTVRITTTENQDLREAIFKAFTQAGLALLGLQMTESTLEQVFLELTEEPAAAADPDNSAAAADPEPVVAAADTAAENETEEDNDDSDI